MSITWPEPEYVRVRDKSVPGGQPFSIIRSSAESDPEVYEILDQPAADHNGFPLPPGPVQPPEGFEAWTVAELREEIASRNEGRDEANQIPAQGNKPDLIQALEADTNPSEES